ncbi:hypothetical protein DYB30_012656 [Aphanomyces astaci]|uniref:Copper transport protein n=1 Tax=Aphanomyces astaci TaxID=112090 RepID=A0A397FC55_APHAT|nr:hypothetical protein DYB30_012656 [Aphanomyces astaci]RHY41635.1 hypothetical protein DYB38_004503 [Aphanomyces astaci]RHY96988.1 hypothetical protein DYB26_010099 [Aphanomyces astaci]RHZ18283.1 hypothetical protein DYB31_011795 [Aphanomyces astaci]
MMRFLGIVSAAVAFVVLATLPSTDAHASHAAHAAQATAAAGIHDDKHCPLCNMYVKDDNLTWFTELKNGQRIYTCGMTNGTQFSRGKNSFSHPSLVGATLGSLIVPDGTGCNATCPECDDPTTPVLDPITGTKITSAKFTFLCLKKGQKIYFESDTSKATFTSGALSKSGSNGEPFCSGSSAMFSGFQTTVHGTCVKLLFQPWVLNSQLKYALGFIGVFLLPLLNEGLVHTRESLRQSFRQRPTTSASTKRLHKLTLTVLYMGQMTLAYFAMLVVMIYDTGLFVSLIFGFGVGYMWFKEGKRTKDVAVTKPSKTSDPAAGGGPVAPWRFQRLEDLFVLYVPQMKCMANCGSTVQRALEGIDGVDQVYVDINDKCVYVLASSSDARGVLVDAVDAVGFHATILRAPN